ncbi:hypothetical protein BC830DRAFT_1209355 [Chytriomyces sp. MP71]|nr:hypothetical protein BC830DRAFT_1209355 [Chytriomyces sp. MP71]
MNASHSATYQIFASVLFFGTLYLYFTAPSFQTLKTLPPHLSHLQHQTTSATPAPTSQSFVQGLHQIAGAGAGSIMGNPAGMPQFGVPAGAAQMHHHYYGLPAAVSGIHAAHVVDRGLRKTVGGMGMGSRKRMAWMEGRRESGSGEEGEDEEDE